MPYSRKIIIRVAVIDVLIGVITGVTIREQPLSMIVAGSLCLYVGIVAFAFVARKKNLNV